MKQIKLRSLLVFLFSFIATFLMSVIPHLISRPVMMPVIFHPDVMNTIEPLLDKKPKDFDLHKPTDFIPTAQASADYDLAKAYVVVNFDTGDVIASKNLDKKLPIASLT